MINYAIPKIFAGQTIPSTPLTLNALYGNCAFLVFGGEIQPFGSCPYGIPYSH